MWVLDTNTLIYFFRGEGNVAREILSRSPSAIGIPSIVLYELEVGIGKSTSPRKRLGQLQQLTSMLIAEPRRRRDGSSTSNRYRLLIAGGDNLSPPGETGDTRPGQACRGDPDVPVTPGTTNRIAIDPPQPGAGDEQQVDSVTVESGSGHCLRLDFPKALSPSGRADAQRRLARLPPELAQQLLDELAAHLKACTIRASPLVYLAGLIKRANAGRFVPEAALHIAHAREKRRRNESYLERLKSLNDEPMPNRLRSKTARWQGGSPISLCAVVGTTRTVDKKRVCGG